MCSLQRFTTVAVNFNIISFIWSNISQVWGVDDSLLPLYINIESDDSIVLARGKPLQDTYLQKLVSCMEKLFFDHYGVLPSLVADVNQHVYRSAGCVGVSLDTVIMETKAATEENRLFRCLLCSGITNIPEVIIVWLHGNCLVANPTEPRRTPPNPAKFYNWILPKIKL